MSKFDSIIFDIAADNYGLITSAQARNAGVGTQEMVQYARRGRIERVGHSVYRLTQRIPEQNDPYALAVALVGPDSYLFGEAVLGLLNLCPTNPAYLHVATPKRTRKNLPNYIRVVHTPGNQKDTIYEGIPCQHVVSAIRTARKYMLPERLADATVRAREEGYITKTEAETLLNELKEKH